jgi:hypothetical protein
MVDVLPADGLQHDGVDVFPCGGGRLYLVDWIQTVMHVRMIKEEGVHVLCFHSGCPRGGHITVWPMGIATL